MTCEGQAYHVCAPHELYKKDDKRVAKEATIEGVADSDVEVEKVARHEQAENGNASPVVVYL